MALDDLRRRFPIRALLGGERVQVLAQPSTIISGAELAAHVAQIRYIWLAWTACRLARWMLDLVNGQLDDVVVHPNLDLTIMLGHMRRGSIQLGLRSGERLPFAFHRDPPIAPVERRIGIVLAPTALR